MRRRRDYRDKLMRVMFRRLITLASAFSLLASPVLAAARPGQAPASLSGTASNASGQALGNTTVQLRNITTGQLAGTTTSTAAGAFSFTGLSAGQYAVEVVNAAGQIIGTSAAVTVSAGAAVTGVAVTSSAALAGAAGAAGAAAAGGAAAGTGVSTGLIIGLVAAAAGIATVVAVTNNASPSR